MPLFAAGALIGFIGYSVIHLLPDAVAASGMVALDLLIAAMILLGLALTIELHKHLFRAPSPLVLRDAACAAGLGYFIFVISPHAFWIYPAMILWFMGCVTVNVAAGSIIMRSWKPADRIAPANRVIAGLICGIAIPKLMFYYNWNTEWIIHTGLVVTLLLLLRIHVYARRAPEYRGPFSIWNTMDLWRDKESSGLIAISVCWGAIIGILLREDAYLGPSLIGILAYIVFSRKIFRAIEPWRASVFAVYLASISLLLDGVLWGALVLSSYTLAFSAALIFTAVRTDAFVPLLPLSFAEQMSVHNWGGILGYAAISTGVYLVDSDAYRLVGSAFALFGIAFLAPYFKRR